MNHYFEFLTGIEDRKWPKGENAKKAGEKRNWPNGENAKKAGGKQNTASDFPAATGENEQKQKNEKNPQNFIL